MKRIPSLASVMTPFPHAVDSDQPIGEARKMMDKYDFHHLPVTRDGELVGIVSLRAVLLATQLSNEHDGDLKVAAIHSTDPYIVDIATHLDEVVSAMAMRHMGSALVVKKGKLVGIFTATDLARALSDMLRRLSPSCGPDETA